MQLFIIYNETLLLKDIDENITITDLKKSIYQKNKVPIESQTLQYSGKILNNKNTLKNYNIPNNSFIYLNTQLKGGAKFPNIGVALFLISATTIIFLSTFFFFYLMTQSLLFVPTKDCSGFLIPDFSNTGTDFGELISSFGRKKTEQMKGGNNNPYTTKIIYYSLSILYCALISVIYTIYSYIYYCNKHEDISIYPIIAAHGGNIFLFVSYLILYNLRNYIFFQPMKKYYVTIVSSLFAILSIALIFFLVITKINWNILLFPFLTVIISILAYFFFQWDVELGPPFITLIIKLAVVTMIGGFVVFAPYLWSFSTNSVQFCK